METKIEQLINTEPSPFVRQHLPQGEGSPLENFKECIEKAFDSGDLKVSSYDIEGLTQEDIQNTLQSYHNELQKIRSLRTEREILLSLALLLEKGNIEELDIFDFTHKSELTEFPSCVRIMTSLRILSIDTKISSIPDWIGELQSLTEMSLGRRFSSKLLLASLPDSMRNLKNLEKLSIEESDIEKLPDWIGELESLTELSLKGNNSLKALPESIGNLKNLKRLILRYSAVEKLPDSIVNCTALEFVDICKTRIRSVPDSISSVETFIGSVPIELIPQGWSLSYRCFCNSYYRLAKTILQLSEKARKEGPLALEDDWDTFAAGFFSTGLRLVIDGTDTEVIKHILLITLEREHDYYRKTLMKVALEGVLSIQAWDHPRRTAFRIASLVNIKNNPLDAACAEYRGDLEAFSNIDFDAAIQPEEEREEIRFIKRAVALSEIAWKENILALEEHLDREAIAVRDVFECGLSFVLDGYAPECFEGILSNLIEHEIDPVQKNLALAKKDAVLSIYNIDNYRILLAKLCAYFDESITSKIREHFDD